MDTHSSYICPLYEMVFLVLTTFKTVIGRIVCKIWKQQDFNFNHQLISDSSSLPVDVKYSVLLVK